MLCRPSAFRYRETVSEYGQFRVDGAVAVHVQHLRASSIGTAEDVEQVIRHPIFRLLREAFGKDEKKSISQPGVLEPGDAAGPLVLFAGQPFQSLLA